MEVQGLMAIECTERGMAATESNSELRKTAALVAKYLSYFTKASVGEAPACGISQLLQNSTLSRLIVNYIISNYLQSCRDRLTN